MGDVMLLDLSEAELDEFRAFLDDIQPEDFS